MKPVWPQACRATVAKVLGAQDKRAGFREGAWLGMLVLQQRVEGISINLCG